jgi:hypothetical protein
MTYMATNKEMVEPGVPNHCAGAGCIINTNNNNGVLCNLTACHNLFKAKKNVRTQREEVQLPLE